MPSPRVRLLATRSGKTRSIWRFCRSFRTRKASRWSITKRHYPSYAFDLPDKILAGLVLAAKRVGHLLDRKLEDVGRTGLILEGFAVDHAHAKLFPMHGTRMPQWRPLSRPADKYFHEYEGYISSHDYQRADDAELAALAQRIRS